MVSAVVQVFVPSSAKTLFKSDPTLDGPAILIGEITNTNTERSGEELVKSNNTERSGVESAINY